MSIDLNLTDPIHVHRSTQGDEIAVNLQTLADRGILIPVLCTGIDRILNDTRADKERGWKATTDKVAAWYRGEHSTGGGGRKIDPVFAEARKIATRWLVGHEGYKARDAAKAVKTARLAETAVGTERWTKIMALAKRNVEEEDALA